MKLFLNIVKNWKTSLAGLIILGSTYGPTIWPKYAGVFTGALDIAVGLGLIVARDAAVHTEDHQGEQS